MKEILTMGTKVKPIIKEGVNLFATPYLKEEPRISVGRLKEEGLVVGSCTITMDVDGVPTRYTEYLIQCANGIGWTSVVTKVKPT